MAASACSALVPSDRELRWAAARLAEVPGVSESRVWCNDDFGGTSDLCGEVRLADGSYLMFFSVGYRAVGEDADRVQVARVGDLQPFIAFCGKSGATFDAAGRATDSAGTSGSANFHRTGRFGAHVEPPLVDVVDAIRRHAALEAALRRWPRCPEYWSYHDGTDAVRYCVLDGAPDQGRPPVDPLCAY
jgi:hypothetical protein